MQHSSPSNPGSKHPASSDSFLADHSRIRVSGNRCSSYCSSGEWGIKPAFFQSQLKFNLKNMKINFKVPCFYWKFYLIFNHKDIMRNKLQIALIVNSKYKFILTIPGQLFMTTANGSLITCPSIIMQDFFFKTVWKQRKLNNFEKNYFRTKKNNQKIIFLLQNFLTESLKHLDKSYTNNGHLGNNMHSGLESKPLHLDAKSLLQGDHKK